MWGGGGFVLPRDNCNCSISAVMRVCIMSLIASSDIVEEVRQTTGEKQTVCVVWRSVKRDWNLGVA